MKKKIARAKAKVELKSYEKWQTKTRKKNKKRKKKGRKKTEEFCHIVRHNSTKNTLQIVLS